MAPRNLSSNVVQLKPSNRPTDRRRAERRQPDPRREADRVRHEDLARAKAALELSNNQLELSLGKKPTSPAGRRWEEVVARATARARELELVDAKSREPVKYALFAPNSNGVYVRKPKSAK